MWEKEKIMVTSLGHITAVSALMDVFPSFHTLGQTQLSFQATDYFSHMHRRQKALLFTKQQNFGHD